MVFRVSLCNILSNAFELFVFCPRQSLIFVLNDSRDSWNVPKRVQGLDQVKV